MIVNEIISQILGLVISIKCIRLHNQDYGFSVKQQISSNCVPIVHQQSDSMERQSFM